MTPRDSLPPHLSRYLQQLRQTAEWRELIKLAPIPSPPMFRPSGNEGKNSEAYWIFQSGRILGAQDVLSFLGEEINDR